MKEENKVGKFSFVHPSGISHVSTKNEDEGFKIEQLKKRAQCLADRLIDASTDQLVLVSCNIGFHWILTVIDPYKEVVSVMDPLNRRIHNDDWKTVVNLALQLFNANKERKGKKITYMGRKLFGGIASHCVYVLVGLLPVVCVAYLCMIKWLFWLEVPIVRFGQFAPMLL